MKVNALHLRNFMIVAILSLAAQIQPEAQETPTTPPLELRYAFLVPGGENTSAFVFPEPGSSSKKVVIFEPDIPRTDGALYSAALEALWNIYGKHRGLFQLSEAKTRTEPALGGNSICWPVYNPKQSFCIFPVKDSGSGRIASLRVWLR